MSYDIYFVRRDPGQSFEDALDATEALFQGDPGPLSSVELEQWAEIVPVARKLLGEIDEFTDETTRELSDRTTGIQLSLFNGEMAIHVPIGAAGAAGDVLTRVHELALAVERVTGLEGFDPQTRAPVSPAPGGASAAGRRDQTVWDEDEGFESDGTSTSLPVVRDRREREPGAEGESGKSDRRSWEFWKR